MMYLSDLEQNDSKYTIDPKQEINKQSVSYAGKKSESNYQLSHQPHTRSACTLCNRSDGEIIGPFTKNNSPQVWLHLDCASINLYSYKSNSLKRWVNIDTMLKLLLSKYACFRCGMKGASVACTTCGKAFHGHTCSKNYLLAQASKDEL